MRPSVTHCAIVCSILIPSPAVAAEPSLDPGKHPRTPEYESLFEHRILPLDVRLSWKKRFLGNEEFNTEESLPATYQPIENPSTTASATQSAIGSLDATGVVKLIKASEGKIKIEHTPIERLGMPAMTMVFRVKQPNQLTGLEKGAQVAFNVENSSAGFWITHLEKTGAFDATGTVKQIKASEGKVKIDHGPIERLGMPAMTMMFRVEDPNLLAGLVKGAEVAFNVENTSTGFSVTRLETAGGTPSISLDAQGTVRSIAASQGKVKIEHGPIGKLGMPAMTMMFKVREPAVLSSLKKGMQVEFDVLNSAGGFEITQIRPAGSAASSAAVMEKSVCFRIGPFHTRAKAVAVGARYRKRDTAVKIDSSAERRYVGDMVYIDGHASRAEALATAENLVEHGINDYAVLDEPGKRNVLSLGVFSDGQNARRLKTRVEAMNYPVKLEAVYRARKVYWLITEQSGAPEPIDVLVTEELQSGVNQVPSDCSA